MLKQSTLKTGRLGEQLASEYLKRKGYKILEQNYRSRYAEIDLVVRKKDMLVFVEVRTKRGEQLVTPEETLNPWKLRRVKRNAAAYASHIRWNKLYRIDAVCIVLDQDNEPKKIDHYENI